MKAVKQLGIFWAAVNEPPPPSGIENNAIHNTEVIPAVEKEVKNEIPAGHSASGG
jgi:hypothetical protein